MHNRPGTLAKATGYLGILLFGCLAFTIPARAEERNDGDKRLRFAESARAVVNDAYVPNFQIATVRINGADEYLTNLPHEAGDPEWTRDGSTIYYWAITDGPDGIFWIPAGGGTPTQVDTGCSANPDCLGDGYPAISPNGRRLLTERAFLPIDDNGNATNPSIFAMNIDGSGATQVTFPPAGLAEDHAPRWSPNGHRIVFERVDQGTFIGSVWITDADGTNAHQVTPAGMSAGNPDWSPEGDEIVFQSPAEPDPSTPQQIYKIRPNGMHLVQLTTYAFDPDLTIKSFRPRWSPDGERIAFTHVDPTTTKGPDGFPHGDIFVMNPNGSHVVQVTQTPDAQNGAAWDPRPFRDHHGDDDK
jgi:Tol biopolymer transport system component